MGGDAQSRVGLEKSVAVVLSGTIFPTSANAGVAQLVEHFLAKEDVARSNRVTRSTHRLTIINQRLRTIEGGRVVNRRKR